MDRLQELDAERAAKRDQYAAIFKQYPDNRFPSEVAQDLETRGTELNALSKEIERLRAIKANADAINAAQGERPRMVSQAPSSEPQNPYAGKTLGQVVTDHASYTAARDIKANRFTVELPGLDFKTLITTSAGFAPANNRTGRVVLSALRRPVVADLIPQDATTDSLIKYMEETTFTNAADSVAEGALKPESALVFTERSVAVQKIATWVPITQEQLDDVPQFQGILNNRLTLMLQLEEERQLLNGDGTPPDLIGFYNKVGIQTQALGGDARPTAVYKAMTKVRSVGFAEPTGLVIHPNDWQDFVTLQEVAGAYIWGRPQDDPVDRIWGMPVVVTTAATEGTALLGDFQLYSHISRRQGITIKVADQHSDYAIYNKLAVIIEERLSLEIYRAAAFATVTGL
jgi:HK97 family phage major capsid protein